MSDPASTTDHSLTTLTPASLSTHPPSILITAMMPNSATNTEIDIDTTTTTILDSSSHLESSSLSGDVDVGGSVTDMR